MATINPYLNFNGTTEEAFEFYRSIFGGEFTFLQKYKDAPDLPGADKMSESDLNKIMHVSLPIGGNNVLMASDSLESMGQKVIEGNNYSISIDPESEDEARRLFSGLAAGGEVEMPLEDQFWGSLFGMVKDKFGIRWMVDFQREQQG